MLHLWRSEFARTAVLKWKSRKIARGGVKSDPKDWQPVPEFAIASERTPGRGDHTRATAYEHSRADRLPGCAEVYENRSRDVD